MANSLLGLPPVVVGLALNLLLSHTGPLGWLRLLFTPTAMVIAQAVLALPFVTALAHRSVEDLYGPNTARYWYSVRARVGAVPVVIDMRGSRC